MTKHDLPNCGLAEADVKSNYECILALGLTMVHYPDDYLERDLTMTSVLLD